MVWTSEITCQPLSQALKESDFELWHFEYASSVLLQTEIKEWIFLYHQLLYDGQKGWR